MAEPKLKFQKLLPPDEEPITSVAQYLAARRQCDELSLKLHAVQLEMKKQREQGKEPDPQLFDEFHMLDIQERRIRRGFSRRLPLVLISRCPYCGMAVWMKVGTFSLADEFWYREDSDGRDDVPEESRCSHLFCVDGALNLNGYQPIEAHAPITVVTPQTIPMAAEVPFVKPRVLNLPTMVAVIHSFPVAEKYTAYPVVYFAQRQPPQEEYCIGWARQEYLDHDREHGNGVVIIGKRTDAQDYELEKWVRRGKLFWLDPAKDEHLLVRGPAESFPYGDVAGRRNPYAIKDGDLQDLPNPSKDEEPRNRLEW